MRGLPIRDRKDISDKLQHVESPPVAIKLAFDRLKLEDVQYVVHSRLSLLHISRLSFARRTLWKVIVNQENEAKRVFWENVLQALRLEHLVYWFTLPHLVFYRKFYKSRIIESLVSLEVTASLPSRGILLTKGICHSKVLRVFIFWLSNISRPKPALEDANLLFFVYQNRKLTELRLRFFPALGYEQVRFVTLKRCLEKKDTTSLKKYGSFDSSEGKHSLKNTLGILCRTGSVKTYQEGNRVAIFFSRAEFNYLWNLPDIRAIIGNTVGLST